MLVFEGVKKFSRGSQGQAWGNIIHTKTVIPFVLSKFLSKNKKVKIWRGPLGLENILLL